MSEIISAVIGFAIGFVLVIGILTIWVRKTWWR